MKPGHCPLQFSGSSKQREAKERKEARVRALVTDFIEQGPALVSPALGFAGVYNLHQTGTAGHR